MKDFKMKTFAKIISGLALASASLYAAAAPISVTDNTGVLNLAVTDTASNSFTIDLTDDGFGFVPGAGSVSSGTLHVTLSDLLNSNEQWWIYLGSNLTTAALSGHNIANNGVMEIKDIVLDAAALADLSADGKLLVTFKATLQGGNDETANYSVVSASLNAVAQGTSVPANSVPEPASLGLMGITLAGLAAVRRRKQK
jgi:hypothetical protein